VLADHGEMVGEQGAFGHVTALYEEDLRVPFAIRNPEKIPAGTTVDYPISTLGTFATILDLLELDAPDSLQVSSLMPAVVPPPQPEAVVVEEVTLVAEDGTEVVVDEPVAAPEPPKLVGQPVMAERYEEHLLAARFKPGEANGDGPLVSPRGRYRTYRMGDLKLVQHYENGEFSTHLYDLAADPGEMNDIANVAMRMMDRQTLEKELSLFVMALGLPALDAEIDASGVPAEGSGNAQLDEAAQEQLRALGYIE